MISRWYGMARPRKINIVSLAKEANVSIATISRVLNNHQGVSEPLRMSVRKILEGRGYQPRTVTNRRANIAIISEMATATIENFMSQVLSGIAEYGFEQCVDTSIVFVNPGNSAKVDLLKILRERRCDGAVFIFASNFDDGQIREISEGGLPGMLISSRREIEGIGFIDIDSYDGGITATRHLLALGHSKICFLSGPLTRNYDNQERIKGFKKVISDAGLLDEVLIVDHQPTRLTLEAGYKQAQLALKIRPDITAMFANNDEMAYGAMLACAENGKNIPNDISIIGFDDCPFSRFSLPPLTTVRQPLSEIGYEAIKMVDMKVRGVLDRLPRKILQGVLVERKSTGPARKTKERDGRCPS
ncbi:MAG TPA: LacI family transcriptional regulator [Lentisphaeria bacterium]|nr:LacI family transcriptional regulator [Lentisphaeria bacterium]